jgi:hypothetical protein
VSENLNGTDIDEHIAVLDALGIVGDADRARREASPFATTETIFAPFALRAIGLADNDQELLRQACERFETLELDWHAEQTRLAIGRRTAMPASPSHGEPPVR